MKRIEREIYNALLKHMGNLINKKDIIPSLKMALEKGCLSEENYKRLERIANDESPNNIR